MSGLDYKGIFEKVTAWQSEWKDAAPVAGKTFENPAMPGAMKISPDTRPGTHAELEKPTDINAISSQAAIMIVSPVMPLAGNLGVETTYKIYEDNENMGGARFVLKFF